MENLYPKLEENNLIDSQDDIILSEFSSVPKSTFEIFFGDCAGENCCNYACMSGSHTFLWGDPPQEYTRTATELGYQTYFDEWLQLGILTN